MKNILFIVPSLRRAGAETQVIDLVNAIDKTKYKVYLISFSHIQDQLDRIDHNSVVYHHFLRKSKFDTGYITKISQLIDTQSIDLVHCTLQFSLLVASAAIFLSRRSPRLIDVVHTTQNRGIKEELHDRLLYQWLMRRCCRIIFVCKNQRTHWINKFSFIRNKSEVIYNGIDVYHFNPETWAQDGDNLRSSLSISNDNTIISCIAGFRKEKAHDLIVKALHKASENIHVIFAGDGPMVDETKSLVDAFGLSDRVHFLGLISDVRPILAASNATLLASTAVETFSIAMLESMAMATPMISTNIGGMSEAILPGETGWLFNPGIIDEITSAMNDIDRDHHAAEIMGKNARENVTKLYTIKVMAEKTEHAIDECTVY